MTNTGERIDIFTVMMICACVEDLLLRNISNKALGFLQIHQGTIRSSERKGKKLSYLSHFRKIIDSIVLPSHILTSTLTFV
jgi:hypothetical protein